MNLQRRSENSVRIDLIALFLVIVAAAPLLPAQQNPYVQLNRKPYFVVFFVKGEAWNAARPNTRPGPKRRLTDCFKGISRIFASMSNPGNMSFPVRWSTTVLSAGLSSLVLARRKRQLGLSTTILWFGASSSASKSIPRCFPTCP